MKPAKTLLPPAPHEGVRKSLATVAARDAPAVSCTDFLRPLPPGLGKHVLNFDCIGEDPGDFNGVWSPTKRRRLELNKFSQDAPFFQYLFLVGECPVEVIASICVVRVQSGCNRGPSATCTPRIALQV